MGLACSNSPKEAAWNQIVFEFFSVSILTNDSFLPATKSFILLLNKAIIGRKREAIKTIILYTVFMCVKVQNRFVLK